MLWIFCETNTLTVLVAAEQCIHRAKDFSTSHAALPETRSERTRTQSGQLTPAGQKYVPYHVVSHLTIKPGVKEVEVEDRL